MMTAMNDSPPLSPACGASPSAYFMPEHVYTMVPACNWPTVLVTRFPVVAIFCNASVAVDSTPSHTGW